MEKTAGRNRRLNKDRVIKLFIDDNNNRAVSSIRPDLHSFCSSIHALNAWRALYRWDRLFYWASILANEEARGLWWDTGLSLVPSSLSPSPHTFRLRTRKSGPILSLVSLASNYVRDVGGYTEFSTPARRHDFPLQQEVSEHI